MGRRKTNVVTLEVPEEPIEETLPEKQPEENTESETADAEAEATETPADTAEDTANAERQADLDLAAEDAAEAAEAAAEAMKILGQIEEATREVDYTAEQVERVKKELKLRKEVYENRVERLKELCRTRMEKHPLFDGLQNDQNDGLKNEDVSGGSENEQPVDEDAWKNLPLLNLGLPSGVHKSLLAADIGTIGELRKEMNADPLSWWEDISGIEPVAIEAIAEKFAEFWKEHPEYGEYGAGDDGEIDAEYEVDEDESDDEDDSDEDDE